MPVLFGMMRQIHVFITSNTYLSTRILTVVIWIGLKKPFPLEDEINVVPIVWLGLNRIKLLVSRTGSAVFLGHDISQQPFPEAAVLIQCSYYLSGFLSARSHLTALYGIVPFHVVRIARQRIKDSYGAHYNIWLSKARACYINPNKPVNYKVGTNTYIKPSNR